MKVYFITDHPFWESDGSYYSGGGLPYTIWDRYLLGDVELCVIGRYSKKPNITLSSRDNVSFKLSKLYQKPQDAIVRYKKVYDELTTYMEDADRVIIRLPSWLGLIAQQICLKKNIPYATEVVADAYDSYRNYGNLSGLLFASLYHQLNRIAISKSKYTLYVTQEYLQKRYPNENYTLGCTDSEIDPVDIEVLQRRLSKIEMLKENASITCGQIGNISVKYKGYHIMLKAMAELKETGIKLQYHIAGGGSAENILLLAKKYGIEDQVIIRGRIPHEEIPQFIDSLDIYVHPSFQEGLPRVIVEAISRGCPCLTSDVAGTPELIEESCLHHTGDVEKLCLDLHTFIENTELMKQAAVRNYNHAKQYYSDILDKKRSDFYTKFYKQQ